MDFLVIDDEKSIRDAASMLIDDEGHYAETAVDGAGALALLKEEKFDAVLLDLHLGEGSGLELLPQITKMRPGIPVVIFTAQGSVQNAVDAMRLGAVDFIEKPFTRDQFRTVLARLTRFRQMGQRIETLEKEVKEIRGQSGPEARFDFETPVMKEVMDVLYKAARAPASILILGESGTGKSVVAKAVHEASHLKDKPFVTVSCPSLSKELLQSELFGHAKGSFTGAIKDYWGKVKQAEGGTLFLDEIGELPVEIQPKLLRLLQEREYERVGESVVREANVRVIAATNQDLKKRVAEGTYREDLYFRLNVITVEMPPLRARPDDLLRFAESYAAHFASQIGRKIAGFTDAAKQCLRQHPWPGNLRELRNTVERAVILCSGSKIEASDLPPDVRDGTAAAPGAVTPDGVVAGAFVSLEQLEEAHIRRIVEQTSSLSEAAQILGIDQATLYRKRKKMGME
jgi:two-component system, NtrC family, response regulator AlgB